MAYTRLQTAYPRRSQTYWERCLGAMEGEDYEIEVLRRQDQFFRPFSYSYWKRNGSIKVKM